MSVILPKRNGLLLCAFAVCTLFASMRAAARADVGEPGAVRGEGAGRPAGAMTRRYDPVEVNGAYLEPLLGKPIRQLSLFAWREGAYRPVVFQVDERTPDRKMVLPYGPEGRPEDGNGVLDPQDVLVFMVADAGGKAPEGTVGRLAGCSVGIELHDPDRNENGHVTLNWDPDRAPLEPLPPKIELVPCGENAGYSLTSRRWTLKSRVNRIHGEVFHSPLSTFLACSTATGGSGEDLLDAMKLRMKASFLFDSIKVSFDESNILGGMKAAKVGPVRVLTRYWMRLVLPLGIKGPRMYVDMYCYDTMHLVPSKIKAFVNPGYFLSSAETLFGVDLSENAVGMTFYNSSNPEGFLIDGRMSEMEKAMDTGLDGWRAVVGPQGALITASVWDRRFQEQADIVVEYLDDLTESVPPEQVAGSMGFHYSVSRLRGLKPGTYRTLLSFFCPDHAHEPGPFRVEQVQEFLDVRERPLSVTVGGQRFANPAGWPPMLGPE